jgi:peptide/nickel transport system substrate-binding protein
MKKFYKAPLLILMFVLLCGMTLYAAGDLIVAQQTDAKSLDPTGSNDVYSHNLNLNIYDRLFDWSSEMKVEPSLAESYTQIDPLTLEVKIKKGVKFHNGDELTAEDVKFTLERAANQPQVMVYFSPIKAVDIIGPYTIRITTEKPYGPLVNALAHAGGSIVNKKYVTADEKKAFLEPIGTGPFKMESWQSGDRIILTANKNYFQGPPGVDKITYRVIPESVTRAIALETREVDIVLVVDPVDAPLVKAKKYLKVYEMPALSMTYLGFNCEKAPLSDRRVRRAIVSAINLSDIVDTAFLKAAVPANSAVPQGVMGFNKKLKAPLRNIEESKALLKDAGIKDRLELKLWINENKSREDSAVIMQAQLAEVGIDVTIEKLDWGAYLDKLGRGEHDLFILGWSSSPDPNEAMDALFNSKNKGHAGNRSFYGNARVDELLSKGAESTDPAVRIPLYEEAQEIVCDEVAVLPLVNPINIVTVQDYIEGFEMNPRSMYFMRNVKKNK